MSKNTDANPPKKVVRQQGQNKPEITELSFEAMETISGGLSPSWCCCGASLSAA